MNKHVFNDRPSPCLAFLWTNSDTDSIYSYNKIWYLETIISTKIVSVASNVSAQKKYIAELIVFKQQFASCVFPCSLSSRYGCFWSSNTLCSSAFLKTITSLFTAPKRCSYISESRYLYVKLQWEPLEKELESEHIWAIENLLNIGCHIQGSNYVAT